jgi:hypothetical protein
LYHVPSAGGSPLQGQSRGDHGGSETFSTPSTDVDFGVPSHFADLFCGAMIFEQKFGARG